MLAALRHTLIRTWGTLNKQAHSAQHPRTATKKMTSSMLLSCHIKILAHKNIIKLRVKSKQRVGMLKGFIQEEQTCVWLQMKVLCICIVLRNWLVFCRPSEIGHLPCRIENGRSHVKCSHIFSCNNQTNTEYFYQHFTSSMFSKIFDWCFKQGNKSSNIGCYPNVQGAAESAGGRLAARMLSCHLDCGWSVVVHSTALIPTLPS